MGRDRTSTIEVNGFKISTDKDHMGYYRGKQALIKGKYRGWHYHVKNEEFSQDQIMNYLEFKLRELEIEEIKDFNVEELAIGTVEHKPKRVSYWKKGNLTVILWLSGFNGDLHVEHNKSEIFLKSLWKKQDLINIFQNYPINTTGRKHEIKDIE